MKKESLKCYFQFLTITALPFSLLAGLGLFFWVLHISGGWKSLHLHGVSVAFTFGYTLHLGEMWGPPHKKQTIPGPENCSCLLFAILSLVMGLVCFPCLFSLKWIFLTWFFGFWPLLLLLSCLFLDATFSNSLKVCSLVGLSFVEDLPLFFCFFFTLNAWHNLASVQADLHNL